MKRIGLDIGAGLFVLLVVIACSSHGSVPPPPSTQDPPLPPSAQQVQISFIKEDMPIATKILSYHAPVDSADIMKFYRNALSKEQWIVEDTDEANRLDFYWAEGCPMFHMILRTAKGIGQTEVEVKVITESCR